MGIVSIGAHLHLLALLSSLLKTSLVLYFQGALIVLATLGDLSDEKCTVWPRQRHGNTYL